MNYEEKSNQYDKQRHNEDKDRDTNPKKEDQSKKNRRPHHNLTSQKKEVELFSIATKKPSIGVKCKS